uniref:Large ribosomal subunit protein eL14 n=1 Tax=Biomphalaria glabrata TaxID=6526 RepID=A0A2C9K1G1_BIOGL
MRNCVEAKNKVDILQRHWSCSQAYIQKYKTKLLSGTPRKEDKGRAQKYTDVIWKQVPSSWATHRESWRLAHNRDAWRKLDSVDYAPDETTDKKDLQILNHDKIFFFQPYSRFVEIGRVAYIAHGADKGKLIAIVDVIDQNRALVDGPCSGVGRKDMNFKALHLTPYTIKINHSARTGTVKKAWEAAEVNKKWEQSTWAKKLATAKRRTELTDFERFKLMKAKQAVSYCFFILLMLEFSHNY